MTPPLKAETEITGPVAAKLFVSSSTTDADLFLVLRVFSAGPEGDRVPGRDRSAHADRARLAARLAPQARPEALDALPALSHPRREAAAHARQAGRARHRAVADLDRGAGRLSRRAHGARQGLRIWRRLGREAVELQERAEGLRAVPARRSGRPAAGNLRRADHAAFWRRQAGVSAAPSHSGRNEALPHLHPDPHPRARRPLVRARRAPRAAPRCCCTATA